MPSEIRMLVVNGYSVGWDKANQKSILSPYAEAICVAARNRANLYDLVLCIGGWDSPELPPDLLIGMAMRDRIRALRCQTSISVPAEIPFFRNNMPPRDSVEEAILLREYLRWRNGRFAAIDILAVRQWAPRLRLIYQALGIWDCTIIPIETEVTARQRVEQGIAYGLARIDPTGTRTFPFIGSPFVDTRERRTYLPERPDRVPLINRL